MEKPSKSNTDKNKVAKSAAPAKPTPVSVPPLFRKFDWIVMGITFAVIWGIYLFTLAPELTLEDCGELCTGSFYAGIPHPPGYPFWAIYSWLWTAILPFGNVAWRVEVGESFGVAAGCAIVAFMVSRGSSMLIEGIEELRSIPDRWEKAICMVAGFVAGMMVGLDDYVWNEAVVINRISVFAVPWLLLVLLCLMRWMYAPHQKRYLYIGMLLYGICATIHQTLLLSAMGIQVAIALARPKLGRDCFLANSIIYLIGLFAMSTKSIPAMNNMSAIEVELFHTVGIGSILAGGWLCLKTGKIFTEWKVVLFMGLLWVAGVSFYFYEPIAGMTNPPMEWGYPRTVQGFLHALSRGQYETAHGTHIFADPMKFVHQLWYVASGLAESFSWIFTIVGLFPFLFLAKMQKRERSWIIGLASVYFCVAVLLVILLDVSRDRASEDLCKVFFTASHAVFGIFIGYGFTLMAAYMATHYERFRRWGLLGGGIAIVLALYCLWNAAGKLYFGPAGEVSLSSLPHWILQAFDKNQYGSPIFANLILVAMPIIFIGALFFYRLRGPVIILLGLFLLMPIYSGLSHWYRSEQRNHWFGYWFGHDMFDPPFGIYPPMAHNAILFGGTDPGRFCPTYMIFCESFIPHRCQPKQDQHFDRRDVYIITQNALADSTYLDYIRAQYFRSAQTDPPFFSRFFRYVWALVFGDSNNVVMDGIDMGKGNTGNPLVEGICSMLNEVLDKPLEALGAHIEARRRAEGVYPPKEIYTPSQEDSQECFAEYEQDAARRAKLGELEPGEDVKINANGQMQVSGQVAVMMINGLLCKVIFDHNPTNQFYVEESFPLQWMYPYETPSGIIMKLNRKPLISLPDEVLKKDHEFWSKYSARLCGNWITYNTTVQQIANFVEKVYLHNNFTGYTGSRKFIRDDDAQKAFSKLRSSIAGVYAWRLSPQCPPEYRPKNNEQMQALIRETDFAFKQSFAFCPYSPEAVYRYVNFLLQFNRIDDAIIVAKTCLKLDPYNGQVQNLISQLERFKSQSGERTKVEDELKKMQDEARANPTNFQNIFGLANLYGEMRQTNLEIELLDDALTNPAITPDAVGVVAQFFAQLQNIEKLQGAVQKLTILTPTVPEPWYDLAWIETAEGHTQTALKDLQTSLTLSAQRLKTNSSARNLLEEARKDQRFNSLRSLPAFQKIVPSN
jgi:tetratricopeptide (TPR) repeat protein